MNNETIKGERKLYEVAGMNEYPAKSGWYYLMNSHGVEGGGILPTQQYFNGNSWQFANDLNYAYWLRPVSVPGEEREVITDEHLLKVVYAICREGYIKAQPWHKTAEELKKYLAGYKSPSQKEAAVTSEQIEKAAETLYPYANDDYGYPIHREKMKGEVNKLRDAFIAGAGFKNNAGKI